MIPSNNYLSHQIYIILYNFIYYSVLPFDSILSCAATCRSILHDALPLLTTLRIDKASQINVKVASRFRDITELHINSLLKVTFDGEEFDMAMDKESRIRVIPFLSKFDSLERVHFGCKNASTENESTGKDMTHFAAVDCYFWEGEDIYPNEGVRESMLVFIDLLSGALNCGALPKHLEVSGKFIIEFILHKV